MNSRRRAAASGSGMWMRGSKRRRKAGSRAQGRLVAARTTTPALGSVALSSLSLLLVWLAKVVAEVMVVVVGAGVVLAPGRRPSSWTSSSVLRRDVCSLPWFGPPPPPPPSRWEQSASISSMKMMEGLFSRARVKS